MANIVVNWEIEGMIKDKRPGQYIYSYDYELNENWSRVEVSDADRRARIDAFMSGAGVIAEIEKTACEIVSKLADGKLMFTLLSDSHYVKNGNWEYTALTVEAVNKAVNEKCGRLSDGVIHLGDFTDGILSKAICEDYSRRIIDRIISWGRPVFICSGNHDCNYFRGNPELLSENEQFDMIMAPMLNHDPDNNLAAHIWSSEDEDGNTINKLFYRVDIEGKNLVILSLDAYDNSEQNRYGFTQEEIAWIESELDSVPETSRVLIISHDAPLEKLDFWAKEIRNGELLCDVLDAWNIEHDHRILAFLHGHTHADRIFYDRSFPIVSVGCSKIEYFEDKKPFGAIAPVRFEDEVTQELWDTMIIDMNTGDIDLVRFGAGFNRFVPGPSRISAGCNGMASNRYYRCISDRVSHPFIWAHRGASGHAPENTLEAFALAADMGADGIELDVQFTKDRQLVVIHDEWIDRTSNGRGAVADYTLDELRGYNFNNKMPGMPWCHIPTLNEVLELIKSTNMVINIELKTSVNHYPGIEEAVVDLVDEFGMADRIIYSSFNHESVLRVKRLRPAAVCGFLYGIGIVSPAEYARMHGVEAVHPSINDLKYPGFIESCRDNGILIHTWTANSYSEIEQMRQYGVNALITNYPDRAFELFEKKDFSEVIKKFKAGMALRNSIEKKEGVGLASISGKSKRSGVMHCAGVVYGKIKDLCIKIDDKVQKMAGYR